MEYSVCRLCLEVNKEINKMLKLSQETDIFCKIRKCLCVSLTINKELPDKLCKKCVNMVDQIYKFWSTVQENQKILEEHLENGTLRNFYLHLNSSTPIKQEVKTISVTSNIDNVCKNNVEECEQINRITTKDDIKIKDEFEDNLCNDFNENVNDSTDEDDHLAINSFKQIKSPVKVINNFINNKGVLENSTIIISDSKKPVLEKYDCLSCNEVCETHAQLRQHYNQEHTKKNSKATETTYTKMLVNSKIMYKCDLCSKIYSRKYLKRHLFKHTNERPYVCKLCSRTYITVSDIMRHGFRVHSGIKLLCAYKCGFSSAYSGALKEHEDRVHKNYYKYTCEKCGKGFQAKTWYEQHQNIHTGEKPFVCDICGNSFHMEKYLTTHRWKIHPESLDAKRLTCVHCDLKCETENKLHLHLETEHGVIRKKGERKWQALCDLCGKILKRPEEVGLHRRMHLGQKPFKCSICNKQFLRKFTMQVHERSHSRDNAHECEHCGKRYSQQSALYRHQRQQHALPLKRPKPGDNS